MADNLQFATAGPAIAGTLDEGTYSVQTAISWRDRDGDQQVTLLVEPQLRVGAATTVTLDARTATRTDARTPRPAVGAEAQYGYLQTSATARRSYQVTGDSSYHDEWALWATPTRQVTVGRFVWKDQRLLVAPPVDLRVDRTTVAARYLSLHVQDARFDGRHRLPLVFGGHGLPTDLAGTSVRGRVVLLDLTDLCPATAWTCRTGVLGRVEAARSAGAIGVLGYGAVGRAVSVDDLGDDKPVAIPALTVPAAQGLALRDRIGRGAATLTVNGTAATPYVYSLAYPADGAVPARLDQRVTARDLYRFDSRYHADAPGELRLSWRSFVTTGRGVGSTGLTLRGPGTLTEYVGPMRAGVLRTRSAGLTYDAPPEMNAFHRSAWQQTREDVLTTPGHRTDEFGAQPLVHANLRTVTPEQNDYFWHLCTACRSGSMFMPWHLRDSNGLGGGSQTYHSLEVLRGEPQAELRLWGPDGTEVPVREGYYLLFIAFLAVPYFRLPDEPGWYRMTERFPSPQKPQRWARTVESEWTFRTGRPATGFPHRPPLGVGVHCGTWNTFTATGGPDDGPCEPNSQLYLGYDLGLRLDNTLPAGRSHRITVGGYHHSYLPTDPELTSLKLSASFDDGVTWEPLTTRRTARSEYAATVRHPRLEDTTGAVSLRAEGVDSAGNTIRQTVHRAYGLTGR